MIQRRGVILTKDGRAIEAPAFLLDSEVVSWPPTLQTIESGEPVPYLSSADLYHRHEIVPNELYLFAAKGSQVSFTKEQVRAWLGGSQP